MSTEIKFRRHKFDSDVSLGQNIEAGVIHFTEDKQNIYVDFKDDIRVKMTDIVHLDNIDLDNTNELETYRDKLIIVGDNQIAYNGVVLADNQQGAPFITIDNTFEFARSNERLIGRFTSSEKYNEGTLVFDNGQNVGIINDSYYYEETWHYETNVIIRYDDFVENNSSYFYVDPDAFTGEIEYGTLERPFSSLVKCIEYIENKKMGNIAYKDFTDYAENPSPITIHLLGSNNLRLTQQTDEYPFVLRFNNITIKSDDKENNKIHLAGDIACLGKVKFENIKLALKSNAIVSGDNTAIDKYSVVEFNNCEVGSTNASKIDFINLELIVMDSIVNPCINYNPNHDINCFIKSSIKNSKLLGKLSYWGLPLESSLIVNNSRITSAKIVELELLNNEIFESVLINSTPVETIAEYNDINQYYKYSSQISPINLLFKDNRNEYIHPNMGENRWLIVGGSFDKCRLLSNNTSYTYIDVNDRATLEIQAFEFNGANLLYNGNIFNSNRGFTFDQVYDNNFGKTRLEEKSYINIEPTDPTLRSHLKSIDEHLSTVSGLKNSMSYFGEVGDSSDIENLISNDAIPENAVMKYAGSDLEIYDEPELKMLIFYNDPSDEDITNLTEKQKEAYRNGYNYEIVDYFTHEMVEISTKDDTSATDDFANFEELNFVRFDVSPPYDEREYIFKNTKIDISGSTITIGETNDDIAFAVVPYAYYIESNPELKDIYKNGDYLIKIKNSDGSYKIEKFSTNPSISNNEETTLDLGSNTVYVAASDTSPETQARANFICTGSNDEKVIQEVFEYCKSNNISNMHFFSGTYNLHETIIFEGSTYFSLSMTGDNAIFNSLIPGGIYETYGTSYVSNTNELPDKYFNKMFGFYNFWNLNISGIMFTNPVFEVTENLSYIFVNSGNRFVNIKNCIFNNTIANAIYLVPGVNNINISNCEFIGKYGYNDSQSGAIYAKAIIMFNNDISEREAATILISNNSFEYFSNCIFIYGVRANSTITINNNHTECIQSFIYNNNFNYNEYSIGVYNNYIHDINDISNLVNDNIFTKSAFTSIGKCNNMHIHNNNFTTYDINLGEYDNINTKIYNNSCRYIYCAITESTTQNLTDTTMIYNNICTSIYINENVATLEYNTKQIFNNVINGMIQIDDLSNYALSAHAHVPSSIASDLIYSATFGSVTYAKNNTTLSTQCIRNIGIQNTVPTSIPAGVIIGVY